MADKPLTDDPEINAIIAQLTEWEAELKASVSLDTVAKRVNGTIPFVQTLALHSATAVRMALVADVDRAFLFEQIERLRNAAQYAINVYDRYHFATSVEDFEKATNTLRAALGQSDVHYAPVDSVDDGG